MKLAEINHLDLGVAPKKKKSLDNRRGDTAHNSLTSGGKTIQSDHTLTGTKVTIIQSILKIRA